MNAIVELKSDGGIAAYSEFRAQLAQLRADNAALVFDYSTSKGEKEARSQIFTLRKTKGAVESARKSEKAASLEYGRLVDSEAKEIIDQIDEMIELHDRPLREKKEAEDRRIAAIQAKIRLITELSEVCGSAADIREALDALEALAVDESFEEFMADASIKRKEGLAALQVALNAAEAAAREAAELSRLRAEEAERARLAREAEIAQKAAEAARREAEDKARHEQEAAAARERAERQRAERAERDAQEARERAERAAADAEARVKREAEARAKAEAAETARRETDKKHRASVNTAAAKALQEYVGLSAEAARGAVAAIARHQIPGVSISY